MQIEQTVVERIIRKLLRGEDYRIEVVGLIDATFIQFSIDFLKEVVSIRDAHTSEELNWYSEGFLNDSLSKEEIAINSGLNMKTIANMFNSATREVTIDASREHFSLLTDLVNELDTAEPGFTAQLDLKHLEKEAKLSLSELLIVMNAIAVKRAALRGGAWSTAGKRVEKPLMLTLCALYKVDSKYFAVKSRGLQENVDEFEREIDFYLVSGVDGKEQKCEVKLMGKGNPESADAVIARHSKVFVADKLSQANKDQLDSLKIHWVELRGHNGFRRFEKTLDELKIPYEKLQDEILESELDVIFETIFA
jgi:hypothetical protein